MNEFINLPAEKFFFPLIFLNSIQKLDFFQILLGEDTIQPLSLYTNLIPDTTCRSVISKRKSLILIS